MANPNTELAEMARKVAELTAENTRLKTQKDQTKSMSLSVSAKGAISVYGLGRFPVSLYAAQWRHLIEAMPSIVAFLDEGEKLKAFAAKDQTFVQPNALPLKFRAKTAAAAPSPGSDSAL